MKTIREKRIMIVLVMLIMALMLLFSCMGIITSNGKTVYAFTNDANVLSQSTNLGELMLEGYENSTSNVFDGDVFWNLVSLVTGVTNPSTTTLESWDTIRTATDFRSANITNNNKDLSITIKGLSWTPTYLSFNSKNEPILTLWLSTNTNANMARFNSHSVNSLVRYPSNMYGTSEIRALSLNNGGEYAETYNADLSPAPQNVDSMWAIYTMDKSEKKGSIKEFIEVPDNMSWQHSQSAKESASQYYDYSNDSLDSGCAIYDSDYYSNTIVNFDGEHTSYQAWKNDALWLPSVAEVGSNGADGLWQPSVNQRASNNISWLRSAEPGWYSYAYVIGATGLNIGDNNTAGAIILRPAFHLNLKSASAKAGALGITPPTDVEAIYNGNSQTLADVDSLQKGWYNPARIDLTYPTNMINAGTYEVVAKINDATKAEGLMFEGQAIKEGEDEYTRIFYFTIVKKEIAVTVGLDLRGLPIVTLKNSSDIYSSDTQENGRAPTLGFNYLSLDGNGYNSNVLPYMVGSYRATAIILNDNCNYVLDDTYTKDFTIDKTYVPRPTVSGARSKQYTGEDLTFTITGADNANIKIELPYGMMRNGNTFTAKNVGIYKVIATLADNGVATQWADGTTDAIELVFEITKKPLNIVISCNQTDFTWLYGKDDVVITIVGDSHPNDSTELYIYYVNSTNPTTKYADINDNKVINGKTRTIIMPSDIPQGNYTICVELYGDSKDNSNYSLAVPKTAMFTITGNKVTVDGNNIVWKSNDIVINDQEELTYSATTYQISVDESVLASHGAKIDISQGVNGYSGDVSAINAKSGYYSVTVYITNLDSSYESHNSQYTLTYKINKAKYDLSGLSWAKSNALVYNGKEQSMELQGTLPLGLTASYSGNGNTIVGSYTTTVMFSVGENYIDNYYTPSAVSADTYLGTFDFSYSWHIIKASVTPEWTSAGEGKVYVLPTLKSSDTLVISDLVNYTYYDEDGNEITSLPTQLNEEMNFTAQAQFKDEYANNYEFDDGNIITNKSFVIGIDKFPVALILKWNGSNIDGASLPYTGNPYELAIEMTKIGGGVLPADITLTFYKDGSPNGSTQFPVEVGKYRITATLRIEKEDSSYIEEGSAEFDFEIVKADFDISSVKWQYVHGDVSATYDFSQGKWLDGNGQEILPITYDKTKHTLTLIGVDNIKGLAVEVSGNEGTNANDYMASAVFAFDDTKYNAPEFPTSLIWSIAKATIDTSNIVWGYTTLASNEEIPYKEELQYTRLGGGGAVHYIIGLINVPDELKDHITYESSLGHSREQSEVGAYVIEYVLTEMDSNYEKVVMPSGLPTKLPWAIAPMMIATPSLNSNWSVFDGEAHDFAQMFGITIDNWMDYITITITKDGQPYTGMNGDYYKAISSGEYTVKFDLIKTNDESSNVRWEGLPPADGYRIIIKAYTLEVDEWQGDDADAQAYLDNWIKPYIEYRYVDADGNIVMRESLKFGMTYTKEMYVKEGFENDIQILGNDKLQFVYSSVDLTFVEKPLFNVNTIAYDGKVHTIDEFLLKPTGNGIKFEVDGDLKGIGEYAVTISLDGELFVWEDGSTSSYTVTVKIVKASITIEWDTTKNPPELKIPDDYKEELHPKYEYVDKDGNPVNPEDMIDGEDYSVIVTIPENELEKFEFVDNDGNIVDINNSLKPYEFEKQQEESSNNGVVDFGKVSEILKEWWQVIASVISIILIIIFISKGIGYASKRRQTKKTTENKYRNIYAGATGLFGLAMSNWTAIACSLMGIAVLSLIFMLLERLSYKKAVVAMENARDEYEHDRADVEDRKRDENMRMMLMGMIGNNANGGMQNLGIDMGEIRNMIEDAMSRNALPQVASSNDETIQRLNDTIASLQAQLTASATVAPSASVTDEIVQKLIDENVKNREIIQELTKKLPVQSTDIVSASKADIVSTSDETLKTIIEGQKVIIQQLTELSAKQKVESQIIEKEIVKEVPIEVPVEKIVEVPVEKEVIKEVPVEKIVEVPVEKVVEKEVVKEVKVPVVAPIPTNPKREVAPKLTLDEAYAQLSKQQQKYFDGLKEYALSKDKAKEKKSTYNIVIGQSTVNPLIKLTIKKNMTVALFKMEDEYLKDIKRDATSDGTKVRVKETEVTISDAQSCKVAKNMIDLREDQIERYQELLKELRAVGKKK